MKGGRIRGGNRSSEGGNMVGVNPFFERLRGGYLFAEIGKRSEDYRCRHPEKKLISLGIGDVTRPLVSEVIRAMHDAVEEMGARKPFAATDRISVMIFWYARLPRMIMPSDPFV